ncbi:MAG: DUF975 family protein [Verrucomicrobia bacterium]|nr:DUF975 family protein [Verrucomicrobiota bacterium]
MDWFYALEGLQYGPVSWEELQRLARSGQLRPTDYVWNSTMGQNWSKAVLVPNLFPVAQPLQVGMPPPTGVPPVQAAVPPVQPGAWPLYGGAPAIGGSAAYAYTNRAFPASDELRNRARKTLRDNWGNAIAALFICWGIAFGAGNLLGPLGGLVQIIIVGPFELGLAIFFLTFTRGYPASLSRLFEGFSNLGTAINTYMLRLLLVVLWSLLLIIPGIIALYSYRMVFYIIADKPATRPLAAISTSKQMMDGHKGRLFPLDLSFIGWAFLCVLTCGIGFLWLTPYMKAAEIAFYEDLRARTGAV